MTTAPLPSPTALSLSGTGYAHLHQSTGLPAVDPDWGCCMGAAVYDGERCTCWEPVFTPTAVPAVQAAPMAVRSTLCHDCAYRPGSPERAEQDDEQLPANPARPFTCHQGMPVLRGYTHPDADWCPWAPAWHDRDSFDPVREGTISWKADGTPADLCAGWAGASGIRRSAHP